MQTTINSSIKDPNREEVFRSIQKILLKQSFLKINKTFMKSTTLIYFLKNRFNMFKLKSKLLKIQSILSKILKIELTLLEIRKICFIINSIISKKEKFLKNKLM